MKTTVRAATCASIVASAAFGLGQTRTFATNPGPTIAPAKVISTYDFVPQIKSDFILRPGSVSENPSTPWDFSADRPNTLKAGGMLTSTRTSAPRITFPGPGATGYVPPDCDMGVGPQHVVAAVNTRIAFFRKSDGVKQFEQEMDNTGFFSQIGTGGRIYSDPKVFYDPVSQRWFVCILEIDLGSGAVSKVDLAVSDDNNPNGTWFQYSVDVKFTNGGTAYWMDYPSIGCNKDAVVVTGNMFGFAGGYFGVYGVVIPKAPLLSGGGATTKSFNEPGGGTLEVGRTTDPAVDKIFMIARGGANTIKIGCVYGFGNANPTFAITSVSVPQMTANNFNFDAGGGRQLDGFDGRMFTAAWRAGKIVGAHSIAVNNLGAVRWYQVATNNWPVSGQPSLTQSGNITTPGAHAHMPGINVNQQGDISVIFTRSSTSINADLCVASRKSTDPLGTMGLPVLVKSSPVPYGGAGNNRWGDYFQVAIDPVDNSTFWGFGETGVAGGNWGTWVQSWVVTAPGGGASGTPADAISVDTILGNYISGNMASVATSDNSYYSVSSLLLDKNYNPPGSGAALLGQLTEIEELYQINPSATNMETLKLDVEARAVSGVNGMVYFWNWAQSRYDYIGSFSMSASDKKTTINIAKSAISKYVDGTRQVKVRVRGILPVRAGRPTVAPLPFTFSGDQFQLVYTLGS